MVKEAVSGLEGSWFESTSYQVTAEVPISMAPSPQVLNFGDG